MDLKRIIANNIYMLRNKYNLTQQEFVNKLNIGISRGHLSNIENGQNMPSAEFIKVVADTFNIDVNWLLDSHYKTYPDLALDDCDLEFLIQYRKLPEEIKQSFKSIINIVNSK
jgi:transcriptional regulator with XRE-family HTH domain